VKWSTKINSVVVKGYSDTLLEMLRNEPLCILLVRQISDNPYEGEIARRDLISKLGNAGFIDHEHYILVEAPNIVDVKILDA